MLERKGHLRVRAESPQQIGALVVPPSPLASAPGRRIPVEALVRVKIAFGEQSLREVE